MEGVLSQHAGAPKVQPTAASSTAPQAASTCQPRAPLACPWAPERRYYACARKGAPLVEAGSRRYNNNIMVQCRTSDSIVMLSNCAPNKFSHTPLPLCIDLPLAVAQRLAEARDCAHKKFCSAATTAVALGTKRCRCKQHTMSYTKREVCVTCHVRHNSYVTRRLVRFTMQCATKHMCFLCGVGQFMRAKKIAKKMLRRLSWTRHPLLNLYVYALDFSGSCTQAMP